MSNEKKPQKKKVVVTTSKESSGRTTGKKRAASSRSRQSKTPAKATFSFGRTHFMWMGIGLALMAIGMLLMAGGNMEDPSQWNEDVIYSARRTVLAPILILAGLGVEIYAIFKN